MWSLIPVDSAEDAGHLRLLVGKKYTLGRMTADFTINDDKSISRIHAMLEVTHPEANVPREKEAHPGPAISIISSQQDVCEQLWQFFYINYKTNHSHPHKPPLFTVRDSSRFGTVIRNQKFTNSEQLVKSGDTIKFGTVNSVYRAIYEPYVVTTSCLDQGSKRQTKSLVTRLGGHAVSDWRRECQLLVMTSLSVTVKVICALVSLKPIVTVQYLEKLVTSIQEKTSPPNPEDFTPPLAESQLNPHEVSFKKDERRKTLFKGKVFIFLNPKQFKKLNVAVELAGGTPMLMEEGTDDNEDDILVEQTTCVMHADPNDTANQLSQNAHEWVKHVFKVLRKYGRRLIPDCELGFAVLYCSTDRYCNPLMEAAPSQNTQSNVPSHTPSQSAAVPPSLSQVVPPSLHRKGAHAETQPAVPPVGKSVTKPPWPAAVDTKPQVSGEEERVGLVPGTPPRPRKPRAAPGTPPITKFFTKKRPHEDEDKEGSVSIPKVPRIKEELAGAPRRSPRRSPSPRPETSAGGSGSAARRRPVSPITPSHSPSPSPSPSPPPSSRRSNAAARSRTPSPKPARRRNPSPVTRVSPKVEPEDGDGDVFDTFKPRARRRKALPDDTSPKDGPGVGTGAGLTPPGQGQEGSGVNSLSLHRNGLNDPLAARGTAEAGPVPQGKRVKEEVADAEEPSSRLPDSVGDVEVGDARRAPSPLPGGFLTTYTAPKSRDEGHDHEAPSGGKMLTIMARLTIPRRQRQTVVAENNNTINGKPVKNFKKFKKVLGAGGRVLPRLLGGADLRPHVNGPRQVDVWQEAERQSQRELATQEQEADQMFNWQPTKATKKKPLKR